MLLGSFWKSASEHYLHLKAKLCLENFNHISFMRYYKLNAEKSSVALFFKANQESRGEGKTKKKR